MGKGQSPQKKTRKQVRLRSEKARETTNRTHRTFPHNGKLYTVPEQGE